MELPMLTRLRRRFILITMLLVGLVLLAVFSANIISTNQAHYNQIQQALIRAVERGISGTDKPWVGIQPPEGIRAEDTLPMQNGGREHNDGPGVVDGDFVPVFVVAYNYEQNLQTNNADVVFMDAELAQNAVDRVNLLADDEGLLTDLGLFYKRIDTTSETRVAFASAAPLFDALLRNLGSSALIILAALLALFGISLLLSRIALKPVVEAWDKQRRFIADASHELKTPLTVILANNNILLAHPESSIAEQRQWLESTQTEALRMECLTQDLLLLAQTEQDEEKAAGLPLKDRVDLSALVHKSLLQFEAVLFERRLELSSDIRDGIIVTGDSSRIERLLAILLDNACKYASESGNVEVSLKSGENRQQKAILTISNSGEVIAPNDLPHVFERFYRGDASHSDMIEGYGLGLTLAKSIVDVHCGQISVSSSVEAGTTFTVTL
jgi:signal transduction histidine kinase